MNVYFRRADGSLGKAVTSNVTQHKEAIRMVRAELNRLRQPYQNPILAVIPRATAADQQEAA